MNFNKVFIFLAVVIAIFAGQTEAGWLKKIGKKVVSIFTNEIVYLWHNLNSWFCFRQERVGQHTRDAAVQGIAVAQQAANVAATARG